MGQPFDQDAFSVREPDLVEFDDLAAQPFGIQLQVQRIFLKPFPGLFFDFVEAVDAAL